ncbi:Disease resistance protein rpp8 [Thalictrum thalictroides]|uniref:Disease resistance protein rpp8 n=1 Tax=Thalictrum thalictroides TaxID=46969 RepID=A0A7J6WWJ2_THATH|nr:Disease resistance protein rpp8 [Thalictrum thalictroides]
MMDTLQFLVDSGFGMSYNFLKGVYFVERLKDDFKRVYVVRIGAKGLHPVAANDDDDLFGDTFSLAYNLDEEFGHHKDHDHAAGHGRHGTTPTRRIKGILQRIADFFHCLKSGHEIGSQIKDIKARIHEISSRRDRYNLRNLVEQGSTSSKVKSTTKHDPRENALFLEEFQLVGIDGAKEMLVGYLLEADTRLGVVSVFGEGSLGKTTIVKKVYDSPQVKEKFPYRAWITASQTFKATTLLRDLTKQLFPEFQEVDTMESMKLKQALNANLRGKRYLVVLDDI